MCQGRGHFAQRREPRHVKQLFLKLLQPALGFLPFGQIAHKAGEHPLAASFASPTASSMGKVLPSPPAAHHDAADTDDAPLPRRHVTREIIVVRASIRLGHQHAHVPSDRLARRVAEQDFRRGAEGLDGPFWINHDHRIGHGIQDRLEMRLAFHQQLLRPLGGRDVTGDFGGAHDFAMAVEYR